MRQISGLRWINRGALIAFCTLLWLTSTALAQTNKFKLGHVADEETLGFVTWNGWTEPDPKSSNRTEKLLAEESLQAFVKDLSDEIDRVIAEQSERAGGDSGAKIGKTLPYLLKSALKYPTAIVVSETGNAPAPAAFGLVVDAGSDIAKLTASVHELVKSTTPQEGPHRAIEETLNGDKFLRPEKAESMGLIRIGSHQNYFLVTIGEAFAPQLIKRLDQKKTSPIIEQALQEQPIHQPQFIGFVAANRLCDVVKRNNPDPNLPRILDAWGLGNLTHATIAGGLSRDGMQINTTINADGPLRGLFTLIPNKPIELSAFKRIPATASNAAIVRFDLAHAIDVVIQAAADVDPANRESMQNGMNGLTAQLGFSIKDDLASGLGDEWAMYTSGSEAGVFFMPGIVLSASVRDAAKVQKALDVLLATLKALSQQRGQQSPFTVQEYTVRGNKAVRVQFNGVPVPISPAWVLTKDEFILCLTPQLLSSHVAQMGKPSLADSPELKAGFQRHPNPVFVTYSNPKPGLQTIYGLVNSFAPVVTSQLAQQGINFTLPPLPPMSDIEQHLGPNVTTFSLTKTGMKSETHGVVPSGFELSPSTTAVAVALLLPAVQQARGAAQRSQDKNNLKQIAIALHNAHDVGGKFPGPAILSSNKKPLLSWRVHILPYIEQATLYEQFHLDEAWDSPHNKKLIEKMPPVYAAPNLPDLVKEGKTTYLAPKGKGLAWDDPKGHRIAAFTDGTSNTILVVGATRANAVVWTKPDDLEVDMDAPLKALKGAWPGGFHVLMADGSVRFVSDNILVDTFKSALTRNGGEVLNDF